MLRALLALLTLFIVCADLAAEQFVSGEWQYALTNEAVSGEQVAIITAYTGAGGDVTIPGQLDGKTVRAIADSVFYGRASLRSVLIPSSVEAIGNDTFRSCANLSNVAFSEGLRSIGTAAFAYSASLPTITIPNSVTNLGTHVFWWNTNLTSAQIGSGISKIPSALFADCYKLANVTIPASVTSINSLAFNNCIGLTNVVIPNGVTNVGSSVFRYCTNLPSVVLPDSVKTLGQFVFSETYSLTNLHLGKGLTTIGYATFMYCDGLKSLKIPNGVLALPDDAFYDCANLESLVVGSGLTTIGDYAFDSCENLATILFKGPMPSASGRYRNMFGISTPQVFFLPNASGWGAAFGGRATDRFAPSISHSAFTNGSGFGFAWSGTGAIPLNVERCTSLTQGSWQIIDSGVATGVFLDSSSPAAAAFYRVSLP